MSLFDGDGGILRRRIDHGDVGGLISLVQMQGCLVLSFRLTQGRICSYLIVVNNISRPVAAETVLEFLHLVEPNHSLDGYGQSGGLSGDYHLPRLGFFLEHDALVVDQILCTVIRLIVRPILRCLESEENLAIDIQPGLLGIDLVVFPYQ